jgi:hypothetical protein
MTTPAPRARASSLAWERLRPGCYESNWHPRCGTFMAQRHGRAWRLTMVAPRDTFPWRVGDVLFRSLAAAQAEAERLTRRGRVPQWEDGRWL